MTIEPNRSWRVENEAIFRDTINAAAEQLALQPLAVEKDYWVCEALRAIEMHAPGETIFKGGTSLEKLRLIKRFSEDLDLLVIGDYPTKGATERAFKGMCSAAEAAIPGCHQEKVNSGGKPRSMHRNVYLNLPLGPQPSDTVIADPGAILVELGQSGDSTPTSVIMSTASWGASSPTPESMSTSSVTSRHSPSRSSTQAAPSSRSCCG